MNPNEYLAHFWMQVDVGSPVECWEWRGGVNRDGYGLCYPDGKTTLAHRFSMGVARNEPGVVMHDCDNPPCVNPHHLRVSTMAENNADMATKGRGSGRFAGVTHCSHGHEFTPENTRVDKRGSRNCRACARRSQREYQARKRRGSVVLIKSVEFEPGSIEVTKAAT